MNLQNREVKVIDIAVKYGYNSPDAFTRAFQALHGMTPTEARSNTRSLKAYPPMTFRLSIGGNEPMKFRIVKKEAFQVVGIKNKVMAVKEGEHRGVEQVWHSTDEATYKRLKSLSNQEPFGVLHVDVGDIGWSNPEYDYYMGVATTEVCPSEFTPLLVPELTWVVFELKIPWSPDKWQQIYGEWFPSSGYEQVVGPKIQVGPDIHVGKKQVYTEQEVELWIPIGKIQC